MSLHRPERIIVSQSANLSSKLWWSTIYETSLTPLPTGFTSLYFRNTLPIAGALMKSCVERNHHIRSERAREHDS